MKERGSNSFILNGDEPLIEFREADIANDTNLVLSNVSFTLGCGEFAYLVGKVGSGKSSIIKTIIAERPLASGFARVGEFNLAKLKRKQIPFLRRKIGVVFQDPRLLPWKTVFENVALPIRNQSKTEQQKIVREVLDLVGLSHTETYYPSELSGGMAQRAALARALVQSPDILLMDEPFGALDAITRSQIQIDFESIHQQNVHVYFLNDQYHPINQYVT